MLTFHRLCQELKMDASGLRKTVLARGIKLTATRINNRICNTISDEDASTVRGWYLGNIPVREDLAPHRNLVYILQTTPDTKPERIKIGFSDYFAGRLAQHQCASPTLTILRLFPVGVQYEQVLLKMFSDQYKQLGPEMFDVDSVDAMLARVDAFFKLLNIEPLPLS